MKKEDNSVISLFQKILMNSKVLTLDQVRYSHIFTIIKTKGELSTSSKVILNKSISQDRKKFIALRYPSVLNREEEEKHEEMNKAKRIKDSDM